MSLREDALAIWQAGLSAVDSVAAVRRSIIATPDSLVIGDTELDPRHPGRLVVLGAGKAGAGMAAGIEQALQKTPLFEHLSGWVNVPADCLLPLQKIHLHPARPPGRNEPTPAVVAGTNEILQRARHLQPNDVCLVVLSGGGSALLCSPAHGISLEDKLHVTRLLSASGAPIQELNLVRTQLSQVKGGRLANACRCSTLITLVISDVIGDPLETIGSGPTFPAPNRSAEALRILHDRGLWKQIPATVQNHLQNAASTSQPTQTASQTPPRTHHKIVASNSIALAAAAAKARTLGYELLPILHDLRGEAADAGRYFLDRLRHSPPGRKNCLLGGGETTVNVSSAGHAAGRGGRNQEFVLAAAVASPNPNHWHNQLILSGGTDGEDGPTPAAGAWCDAHVLNSAKQQNLSLEDFLRRHDSYTLFQQSNGLLITGPTQTNVMDLAVGLATPP